MNYKKFKIILTVFICLLLLCLGYMGYILYGYHKTDSEYDMIRENYVGNINELYSEIDIPDTNTDIPDTNTDIPDTNIDISDTNTDIPDGDVSVSDVSSIPYRDIDIDGLISQNPDFVGWLYYEDGNVDYPVVKEHEDDIDGYLHRSFDGRKSSAGCIFIPYDASDDFSDMNTFFYGHNMKNGSMFGSLKKVFRSPSKNLKNPYFYIWTKDNECIMYRIISMYVVGNDSSMFAVPSGNAAYKEYLDMTLDIGSIEGLIPFTDNEKQAMENGAPMATFSVCYGSAGTTDRLLIHGVEILREKL